MGAAVGTVDYWTLDNTHTATYGTDLTVNGTVPYSTTGAPTGSTYWAGVFPTDADYFVAPHADYPTDTGSVAFALRTTGVFVSAWRCYSAGAVRYHGVTWFGGQLYFQYHDSGGTQRNLLYTIANNTTYYIVVNWSATSVQLWGGTDKNNLSLRAENTTNQRGTFTPGAWRIGRSNDAGAWSGYIGQFRLLNQVVTTWPTDSSGAAWGPNLMRRRRR